MATLHVRNIPDNLHQRIRSLAEEADRSISAEVIDLLNQAVSEAEMRKNQSSILARIRRNRFRPKKGVPLSQDLLREDRDR